MAQPVADILADRLSPRRLLITGLMLSTLLVPLTGVLHRFEILIIVAGLGSLGSVIYHPTAAVMVREFAGNRTGFAMSIFGLGGTMTHSNGPLAVTGFIVLLGIDYPPQSTILGLLAIALLLVYLPKPKKLKRPQGALFRQLHNNLYVTWKAIGIIWLIAVLWALTDVVLRSFYPILFMQDGRSLVSVGALLALNTAGDSLAAVLCGSYVERRGYKSLFYLSFTLAAPCLLMFVNGSGF